MKINKINAVLVAVSVAATSLAAYFNEPFLTATGIMCVCCGLFLTFETSKNNKK